MSGHQVSLPKFVRVSFCHACLCTSREISPVYWASTRLIPLSSLAQAELCIAIATVFSTFDFELYETDESDVELAHAYLVPYPKWDTKGVRAKVRSMRR